MYKSLKWLSNSGRGVTRGVWYKIIDQNVNPPEELEDDDGDPYMSDEDGEVTIIKDDGNTETFYFPTRHFILSKANHCIPNFKNKLEEEIYNLTEIGYRKG